MSNLNNQPAIKHIDGINKPTPATSNSFFRFSTLYKNIPLKKLFKTLRELSDFYFKVKKWGYMTTDRYGAKWTSRGKNLQLRYKDNQLTKDKASVE